MNKSLRIVCVVLFVSGVVLGQETEVLRRVKDTQEYRSGYQRGREEAEQELKAGMATLYTCGLRNFFEGIDRETGVPFKAIARCVVDDEILGRASGHNDRITEHIKARGLPAASEGGILAVIHPPQGPIAPSI